MTTTMTMATIVHGRNTFVNSSLVPPCVTPNKYLYYLLHKQEKRSADIASVESTSDTSSSSSNTWLWIPTIIASVVSSLME